MAHDLRNGRDDLSRDDAAVRAVAGLPYPEWLGVWPAVALLLAFSWVELVYPSPAVPSHIACLAVGYSILTFAGMFAFGCETWLKHGEVFSLVFGTFARFAPIEASLNPPRNWRCGRSAPD